MPRATTSYMSGMRFRRQPYLGWVGKSIFGHVIKCCDTILKTSGTHEKKLHIVLNLITFASVIESMEDTAEKINIIELMKWVLKYSLIVTVFWNVSGQKIPLDIYSHSFPYSSDSNQSTSEKVYNFDVSSFLRVFGDFESEVDEDNNENDYSNRKSSQPLCLPLALNKIASVSISPPLKSIKLYVLFHSWKSFLPI